VLKVEHWKADVEILGLGGYVVVAGSDGVGFLVLEIVVDKGRAKAAADDKSDDASAHDVVDPGLLSGKRRGRPIATSTVSGLDVGSSSSLHHLPLLLTTTTTTPSAPDSNPNLTSLLFPGKSSLASCRSTSFR